MLTQMGSLSSCSSAFHLANCSQAAWNAPAAKRNDDVGLLCHGQEDAQGYQTLAWDDASAAGPPSR